jgi:hypothetical protein
MRLPLPCVALASAALLAGCASTSKPAADDIPATLAPTGGEHVQAVLHARGVQIYECRAKKDQPGAAEWAFVAPEAELLDDGGRLVGRHYAGPHWESNDGSKLLGKAVAKADAPGAGDIPWLLLATQSVGGAGAFSNASYVQRVHTAGGVAPAAEGCTAASLGRVERVGYRADYRLLGR